MQTNQTTNREHIIIGGFGLLAVHIRSCLWVFNEEHSYKYIHI